MHTFFVNTSEKDFTKYKDILEIEIENKRLITLDCPIKNWYKPDDEFKNYKKCAKKIGEIIDSYKNVRGDFNLILYVDLRAFEGYSSIPFSETVERTSCVSAMRILLRHFVHETIYKELSERAREPKQTLLILETDEVDEKNKDENIVRKKFFELLGFDEAEIINFADNDKPHDEAFMATLTEIVNRGEQKQFLKGIYESYSDKLQVWLKDERGEEHSGIHTDKLWQDFSEKIDAKNEETVKTVLFRTNMNAVKDNKTETAEANLMLYSYILKCVHKGSIFDDKGQKEENVIRFRKNEDINWSDFCTLLHEKRKVYDKKRKETDRFKKQFTDDNVKMAPKVSVLPYAKYGLDEYGLKGEGEPTNIIAKEKSGQSNLENPLEKGGSAFDFNPDLVSKKEMPAPEKMVDEAKKIKEEHKKYLKRLRLDVKKALSNYAGRSIDNMPPLLEKRFVSLEESEEFDDASAKTNDRYLLKTNSKNNNEQNNEYADPSTMKDFSDRAYNTAVMEYLNFNSCVTVAGTDVENQCDWLERRVKQINESLSKMYMVAIGMLLGLLGVYLPFFIAQWNSITENLFTLFIALVSIAVPVVILYCVFTPLMIKQRKQYEEVWKKFIESSDKAVKENNEAVAKYAKLLANYVPSLRYIYEYKLDVDFALDCHTLANAKIAHHKQKLESRKVSVENILEDLEHEYNKKSENSVSKEIDYNVPFCNLNEEGKGNGVFYSILEPQAFNMVVDEGSTGTGKSS